MESEDVGAIDDSGIRIADLVSKHGSKLRMGYTYDFGDDWQHEVVLEKVMEPDPGSHAELRSHWCAPPLLDWGFVPGISYALIMKLVSYWKK